MYGKFNKLQLSKEELLAFWDKVRNGQISKCVPAKKVEEIKKEPDGIFTIVTTKGQHRSHTVILGLGKAGIPLKLGVKGEEYRRSCTDCSKADHYINKKSSLWAAATVAVEAAMGLASQVGNQSTLSYRKTALAGSRKENTQRVEEVQAHRENEGGL